jgi:ArsR family transcriptional regulator, arsenate/arsenite/antimonite-responsive transcriptional repressor
MSLTDELTREFEQHAALFQALSEPLRLDILAQIASVVEMPCTVLVERLPVTKSTISYHIKKLRAANLITVRKDGRNFYYTLRRDIIDHYLPALLPILSVRHLYERERRRTGNRSAPIRVPVGTSGPHIEPRQDRSCLPEAQSISVVA